MRPPEISFSGIAESDPILLPTAGDLVADRRRCRVRTSLISGKKRLIAAIIKT